MFICVLSLFVCIQVSDAYVKVLYIVVFFNINFSFLDIFLFLKYFYSIKYVLCYKKFLEMSELQLLN